MRNTKWSIVAFALITLFGTATCGDFEPKYAENLFECNPAGDGSDCPDTMICFYRDSRAGMDNEGLCCVDENCGRTVKVDDVSTEAPNR